MVVKEVGKSYGTVEALKEVSFVVERGEIFGLIGPDGAGKSTLFRILTTLLLADKGTATIGGLDVATDYKQVRTKVGYMPGRFSLYQDLSVEENLEFFATVFHTTVQENYDLIKDIYKQIEPFRKRRAGALSGGMKQKLALSCALIHKPDMDGIETARQIRKRIGKEITIIVLTSYEFSEIEEDAKAAGVDAFIAKPLFRSRLTATLRQFVSDKKEKTARNYLENLSEADYTGKRILLVEDNELNREIAVEILQMTGAEVETAENGKIAVEKVEVSPKDRYDLIFMDIQMPVLNGYQATAAIRSLPGEKGELPIVAMTANAFAEDVQLAKNTGMNGHIAKPLDMNKLSDVLKKWL